MTVYNKLVRDLIPTIIESDDGKTCVTRALDDNEYYDALKTKFKEELEEFLKDDNVEELIDLEEVLRAIATQKGYTYDSFDAKRKQKEEERGAFKDKIFLEYVND
ncbi:MAG: nucleoside triphosphate pyrophosphohydrolase [Coprobacillus sp.]|nr:nucleoside triphosphate pyrophosphohydrolase [Coprobacillus sp.]